MNIYLQKLTAIKVEEMMETQHISGSGPDAVLSERSLGWFIHLDNHFAIGVGEEKPDIEAGDEVILSLRKKHNHTSVKLLDEPSNPEKKITFAPDSDYKDSH